MKARDDPHPQPHRPKISTESEREKTKLRERRRRSITSRILYGLRKHGNYDLPPRADINDVLKALANEAGWIVEADGTTYRRSHKQQQQQASGNNSSLRHGHLCPAAGPSTGNFLANMSGFNCLVPSILSDTLDLRGGDCSTTASPRHLSTSSLSLLPTNSTFSSPFTSPASSEGVSMVNPFVMGTLPNGFMAMDSFGFKDDLCTASLLPSVDALEPKDWTSAQAIVGNSSSSFLGNGLQSNSLHQAMRMMMPTLPQFNPFLQEAKASNQNTPIGSPQPHGGNP